MWLSSAHDRHVKRCRVFSEVFSLSGGSLWMPVWSLTAYGGRGLCQEPRPLPGEGSH